MQGNAVMRAKRVTGPSAQTILRTFIACERCYVPGCNAQAKITRNTSGIEYRRVCLDHIDKV